MRLDDTRSFLVSWQGRTSLKLLTVVMNVR